MQEQRQTAGGGQERYIFREIRREEATEAARIEGICFPPHEACPEDVMRGRVEKLPETFLVAQERSTGRIAGYINGIATGEETFRDDFFRDFSLHSPGARNGMILGLEVLPEYRGQGLARELVSRFWQREKERGRERLVLTCLDEKVEMYRKFGFRDLGESASSWGGEKWHEMELRR